MLVVQHIAGVVGIPVFNDDLFIPCAIPNNLAIATVNISFPNTAGTCLLPNLPIQRTGNIDWIIGFNSTAPCPQLLVANVSISHVKDYYQIVKIYASSNGI